MRKMLRPLTAVLMVCLCAAAPLAWDQAQSPAVRVRTGFDVTQAFVTLEPDTDGVRRVRLPDALGRLELQFAEAVTSVHLLANGEQRAAPIGSSIQNDRWAWAPPVGYIGAYVLRFGVGTSSVDVEISLTPVRRPAEGESEIRMHLDAVEAIGCGRTPGRCVRVAGWALDPQAALGAGIEAVHVWAAGPQGAQVFLGIATLGVERPDVATAFGAAFGRAGFSLASSTPLTPGNWDVSAYVWNRRTSRWEDARTKTLTIR